MRVVFILIPRNYSKKLKRAACQAQIGGSNNIQNNPKEERSLIGPTFFFWIAGKQIKGGLLYLPASRLELNMNRFSNPSKPYKNYSSITNEIG
jgi:hypothetical protein